MSLTVDLPAASEVRRWRRYPRYKDSGVAWIGEIPEHWQAKRLKHLCKISPSKSELHHLPPDTDVSFLPMERIGEDGSLSLEETRKLEQVWQGFTYFRDGDVLIAKITPCFENGKGALCKNLVNGIGFGTTELYVLRVHLDIAPRFIFYITRVVPFRKLGEATMYGAAGQQRVSEAFIRDFRIGCPSLSEQQAIVDFLDREIGKINALITKKERLVELLQEKRAALISRAVTKGLDTNAPMKDSGVAWIGEIPAHWKMTRLKFYLQAIEQGWSPPCENRPAEPEEWGVLKVGCVNGTQFNPEENKALLLTLETLPELEIKTGDLLISRANTRELLGSASIVGPVRSRLLLCDKLYRLNLRLTSIDSVYLLLLLRSSLARMQFEQDATGASNSMQNISQGIIRNIVMPLPDLAEQQDIAAYLDRETASIDALIARIREGIEKLKEYSTALISAAVTGKIDVRGERG